MSFRIRATSSKFIVASSSSETTLCVYFPYFDILCLPGAPHFISLTRKLGHIYKALPYNSKDYAVLRDKLQEKKKGKEQLGMSLEIIAPLKKQKTNGKLRVDLHTEHQ